MFFFVLFYDLFIFFCLLICTFVLPMSIPLVLKFSLFVMYGKALQEIQCSDVSELTHMMERLMILTTVPFLLVAALSFDGILRCKVASAAILMQNIQLLYLSAEKDVIWYIERVLIFRIARKFEIIINDLL